MAFRFPLDKLTQDTYNVATWHLLFLLPQWCLVLPFHGGATRYKEMQIQLKHFLASDWENSRKDFFCKPKLCWLILTWSCNSQMFALQFGPWPCKGTFSGNSHFSTIFSYTHVLQHILSSHHITPQIKWLFFTFPWRLQATPGPRTFFQFLQISNPTHVTFINKWSFWDDFWTPLGLFSPYKFSEWILSIIPTLFSYCTRPHSTPNCTCPWSSLPLRHDQTFKWNSSHDSGGNIISTHTPCFMSSISWSFCNTLFPTPIWSCN